MSDVAIRVQGVSKQFELGAARPRFPTLRDALVSSAQRAGAMVFSPLRSFRERQRPETFWALRDISFEVAQGEVVGIIGGNGAGKSTLLKILSRITEPTEGRIEIHGRVGSLLEVGTGFHPELTGRENTFLNGAILGMTRQEIARKFDEIVAFAEVERFIDTPVKHYSSGMYLRLAFAVAAHLEPEILIVDEVLAVGDASFQKKCLGKMGDVAREGRTVLFVSHNMDAVQRLCTHCLMLERGRVTAEGPTAAVVSRYLSRNLGSGGPETWVDLAQAPRTGSGEVRFVAARYAGPPALAYRPATGAELDVTCLVESDIERDLSSLAVTLYSRSGTKLVNADTVALGDPIRIGRGHTILSIRIEHVHLNPGPYVVGLWIGDLSGHAIDHVEDAFEIEMILSRAQGFGKTTGSDGIVPCDLRVLEVSSTASAATTAVDHRLPHDFPRTG